MKKDILCGRCKKIITHFYEDAKQPVELRKTVEKNGKKYCSDKCSNQ